MSATPHARVITDKDIEESHRQRTSNDTPTRRSAMRIEPQKTKPPSASRQWHTSAARLVNGPASKRSKPELSVQQRSEAIDRPYLKRIATLRDQVSYAKLELVKLQGGLLGTNTQSSAASTSNYIPASEIQTSDMAGLIEAQRALITSLETQLEDALELARHAGIRRATD